MSLRYLLNNETVQRIDISAIEAYGIKAAKIGFYDLVHQLSLKQKDPNKYDAYSCKDNSRLTSDNAQMIQITADNCLSVITELQDVSHMAVCYISSRYSHTHTIAN